MPSARGRQRYAMGPSPVPRAVGPEESLRVRRVVRGCPLVYCLVLILGPPNLSVCLSSPWLLLPLGRVAVVVLPELMTRSLPFRGRLILQVVEWAKVLKL